MGGLRFFGELPAISHMRNCEQNKEPHVISYMHYFFCDVYSAPVLF